MVKDTSVTWALGQGLELARSHFSTHRNLQGLMERAGL